MSPRRGRAASASVRAMALLAAAWLAATVAPAHAAPTSDEATPDASAARHAPTPAPAASMPRRRQPVATNAARADPLQSAECRRAMAALDAQEAALAPVPAASGAPDPRLQRGMAGLDASRREAARACLASRADPPLSGEALLRPPPPSAPPLAVAPALGPARPRSPAPSLAPTPTTAPPARPYAITSCDAGGCWANDGTRLDRVGPNLVGPRGFCSVQGSLVQCP